MNPNIDLDPEDEEEIAKFVESIPEDEFVRMLEQNKQTTEEIEAFKREINTTD